MGGAGNGVLGIVLRGDVVVRQEKGSRVHGGVQPPRSDIRRHDRHPRPPRAALSRKVTPNLIPIPIRQNHHINLDLFQLTLQYLLCLTQLWMGQPVGICYCDRGTVRSSVGQEQRDAREYREKGAAGPRH